MRPSSSLKKETPGWRTKGRAALNRWWGIIAENGVVVGSRFQQGNTSPQQDLEGFITTCQEHCGHRITHARAWVVRLACVPELFERFQTVYLKVRTASLAPG